MSFKTHIQEKVSGRLLINYKDLRLKS